MLDHHRLLLAVIIVICSSYNSESQRGFRRPVVQQYCVTPESYYGTCTTLSYCPQVVNIFATTNAYIAQDYVIALQRSCGTRNINGDPVVCCTQPQIPTTQLPPVTVSPVNPFFSTSPREPFGGNPFLGTTNPAITSSRLIETTTPRPTTPLPPVFNDPAIAIDNKNGTCRGPDIKLGICTPLKQCSLLAEELMRKQQDATFTNFLRASNAICNNVGTNVCCPLAASSGPLRDPSSPSNRRDDEPVLPTPADGCGFTANAYKRIVGGEVSKKGAWPWVALLGYEGEFSSRPFRCGGALITDKHVITAAHCINDLLSFVRLGEHDLSTDAESNHIDITVIKKIRHPDYNTRNGRSDIGMVYLQRKVTFTEFISPICLPVEPALRTKSYVKHTPFVVGWGKTMEGGQSSNVIRELQIPIYDNTLCRERYSSLKRFFTANQFDSAVLCAGILTGGKDTCQGDSGGPLMMPETYKGGVRYYLIGIVSYGIGCARPNTPSVYTSTQYFIDWISDKVADK